MYIYWRNKEYNSIGIKGDFQLFNMSCISWPVRFIGWRNCCFSDKRRWSYNVRCI